MSIARSVVRAALATLFVFCLSAPDCEAAEAYGGTDPAGDAGQARRRADEAEHLYARKDYRGALQKLEEAFRLAPNPAFRYDLGKVHRALGQDGAALAAFERFLLDFPDAPAGRRKAALQQAESLRPRLGTVEVTCDVEGAEILVDGQEHGRTPQARSIWVNPGSHLVLVKIPQTPFGYAERIESVAGAMVQVAARLSALLAALAAIPVETTHGPTKVDTGGDDQLPMDSPGKLGLGAATSARTGTDWVRRAAWIATAGAAMGLVVAGLAERSRQQKVDRFNNYVIQDDSGRAVGRCVSAAFARGGGECGKYYEDLQRDRRLAIGALVATGTLTISAVVAFLASPDGQVSSRTVRASPSMALTDRDVAITWHF